MKAKKKSFSDVQSDFSSDNKHHINKVKNLVYEKEQTVVDGRVRINIKVVEQDWDNDIRSKYLAEDFSIDNLLASGNTELLSAGRSHSIDPFTRSRLVENTIDKYESSINIALNNKE